MANRKRGEVSIRLDKIRHIVYDLNALAEFEGAVGVPLPAFFAKLAGKDGSIDAERFGFKDIRTLLWAGLLRENPKLTQWEAGTLVDNADGETTVDKINYCAEKVMEAFAAFQGSEDETKKKLEEARVAAVT